VKLISNMVQQRNFRVKPKVLKTFLELPLRVHYDEIIAANLVAKQNKKKRKKDAELNKIEDEMKEAKGTIDKITLVQMQADTLHSVTITYFRILKQQQQEHANTLLPCALKGLAKFSHLIRFEYVLDLLQLIKNLLVEDSSKDLSIEATFNCVLTAFHTLKGPGKELNVDVKEYIIPLYNKLYRLCNYSESKHTPLALQCLSAALIKRREFSIVRLFAFVKRLFTTCLVSQSSTSCSLLFFVRLLFMKYNSCQLEQLLENESDKVCSLGPFNPIVEDPEHSNPQSTSAWELQLLRFHFQHIIKEQTKTFFVKQCHYDLKFDKPISIYTDMAKREEDVCIPFEFQKRKHPLQNLMERDSRMRRGKIQARFVRPRKALNLKLFM